MATLLLSPVSERCDCDKFYFVNEETVVMS